MVFLGVQMDPQGYREHQLLGVLLPEMPLYPQKPCQEPTCPYASPVGVVEDRSVLMGFQMFPIDTTGHREHQLLRVLLPEMPLYPQKPCQEPICPYASSVGVVEDRSVLMGFLMVPMDPLGHRKHQLFRVLLPEMPLYPWKPCQEPTHPYASPVGVVEDRSVLMGFPECHNQKANCLRSILSFYRPQKAFWTPKI